MSPIQKIREAVSGFPNPQVSQRLYWRDGKQYGCITVEWELPGQDGEDE